MEGKGEAQQHAGNTFPIEMGVLFLVVLLLVPAQDAGSCRNKQGAADSSSGLASLPGKMTAHPGRMGQTVPLDSSGGDRRLEFIFPKLRTAPALLQICQGPPSATRLHCVPEEHMLGGNSSIWEALPRPSDRETLICSRRCQSRGAASKLHRSVPGQMDSAETTCFGGACSAARSGKAEKLL